MNEVEAGMVTAASVFHPRRAETELLAAGVAIAPTTLHRLRQLGVTSLWVEHDLTSDLDRLVSATPSPALQSALAQLKHDFAQISHATVTAGCVQAYRQIVMELVCELIANRHLAGLTERMATGHAGLLTHCANVAYLAVSVGLSLETYVVQQRRKMTAENARDCTSLGLGAMLHDIGKLALPAAQRNVHETCVSALPAVAQTSAPAERSPDVPPATESEPPKYHDHPLLGYQMLQNTRIPASARQVILNHHQRWDGTGFPDMSLATQHRREGAQQGEAIHIFGRIVAAANVLDNLLHSGTTAPDASADSSRPIIAALHVFRSERFNGWFDPVVRDAMLRRIAPFPVGSRVVLSDGRPAVVVAPSLEQPCRPMVRPLDRPAAIKAVESHEQGENTDHPPAVDLCRHRDVTIVRCSGQPVEAYLFELPERVSAQCLAAAG